MIDEQGKKFKDVAKELNCCEQTVRNRYEQEKKNATPGAKPAAADSLLPTK